MRLGGVDFSLRDQLYTRNDGARHADGAKLTGIDQTRNGPNGSAESNGRVPTLRFYPVGASVKDRTLNSAAPGRN